MLGVGDPGSYYFQVLIHITYFFPMIHFVIKKKRRTGLLLYIFANVMFELLQWVYNVTGDDYRLLGFRYIMVLAFGSYFAQGGWVSETESLVMLLPDWHLLICLAIRNMAHSLSPIGSPHLFFLAL